MASIENSLKYESEVEPGKVRLITSGEFVRAYNHSAWQLLYQWCWLSKYSNRESHNKQNLVKYYYTKYKNTIRVDSYNIIWYNHACRPPMEVIGYA